MSSADVDATAAAAQLAARLRAAYPHVADAAEAIVPIIKAVERRKHPELAELEVRIGTFRGIDGKTHFLSGVDPSFMSRMLCKLESCTTWKRVTPWRQQVDRYYLLPSGLQARSSIEVADGCTVTESPEVAGEARCAITHIIKTEIAHQDFAWHVHDPKTMLAVADEDGVPYCIRVSAKQEEPVFEDELQDFVDDLHMVRLKQRKTFQSAGRTDDRCMWNVDATQVYQAPTYGETVTMLREGRLSRHEMEIECLDPMEHLRRCGNNHLRMAYSLLLRATDLFAANDLLVATGNKLIPR